MGKTIRMGVKFIYCFKQFDVVLQTLSNICSITKWVVVKQS